MTASAGTEADAWVPTPPSVSVLRASSGSFVNLVGFLPIPWISLAGSLGLEGGGAPSSRKQGPREDEWALTELLPSQKSQPHPAT